MTVTPIRKPPLDPAELTERIRDYGIRTTCGLVGMVFTLCLRLAERLTYGIADILMAIHNKALLPLADSCEKFSQDMLG